MTTDTAIRRLFYKLVAAGLIKNTAEEFTSFWREMRGWTA